MHSCDMCGLYFPMAKTLQTHQRLLCKGRKPHSVARGDNDSSAQSTSVLASANLERPYCGCVLQTKSGLSEETSTSNASATSIPSQPSQEHLFSCRSCGKVYKHLCSLKRHQAACDSQPVKSCFAPESSEVRYSCSSCDKIYRSFQGLCRYRKVCASNAVPLTSNTLVAHACKICERTVDSFQGLRQHMRKAHSAMYYAEAHGLDDSSLPVSSCENQVSRKDSPSVNEGGDSIRPLGDTVEPDSYSSPPSPLPLVNGGSRTCFSPLLAL